MYATAVTRVIISQRQVTYLPLCDILRPMTYTPGKMDLPSLIVPVPPQKKQLGQFDLWSSRFILLRSTGGGGGGGGGGGVRLARSEVVWQRDNDLCRHRREGERMTKGGGGGGVREREGGLRRKVVRMDVYAN